LSSEEDQTDTPDHSDRRHGPKTNVTVQALPARSATPLFEETHLLHVHLAARCKNPNQPVATLEENSTMPKTDNIECPSTDCEALLAKPAETPLVEGKPCVEEVAPADLQGGWGLTMALADGQVSSTTIPAGGVELGNASL
jgi:hypothetical protein